MKKWWNRLFAFIFGCQNHEMSKLKTYLFKEIVDIELSKQSTFNWSDITDLSNNKYWLKSGASKDVIKKYNDFIIMYRDRIIKYNPCFYDTDGTNITGYYNECELIKTYGCLTCHSIVDERKELIKLVNHVLYQCHKAKNLIDTYMICEDLLEEKLFIEYKKNKKELW